MVYEDQIPDTDDVEVSKEKDGSETLSEDIVSAVKKRKSQALKKGKPTLRPRARKPQA